METYILAEKEEIDAIADAIRTKVEKENQMSVDEMIETLDGIKVSYEDEYMNNTLVSYANDEITSISYGAFAHMSYLTFVNCPKVTNIGEHAFYLTNKLEEVNFPLVEDLSDGYEFQQSGIKKAYFPSCVTIGAGTFSKCYSLSSIYFPKVETLKYDCFQYDSKLEVVDFPSLINIDRQSFSSCNGLKAIILRSPTICALSNVNAFNYCYHILGTVNSTYNPEGLLDGYIYVPANLLSKYLSATNWSTFANQIRPIEGGLTPMEDMMILRNLTEPISIKWYAPMDDSNLSNPTIDIVSDNENVVSVSNILVTEDTITFDINTYNIDGTVTVTIDMTLGDYTFTEAATYTVAACTWSVVDIEGVTYGFDLNNNGYYESTNAGVQSSYSLCKVNFHSDGVSSMRLNCISSGQSNYDFGILSTVDSTLTSSYSADSSNVFKSFKGLASTSVQTVDYGVIPEGDHFIYVKYRKNSSTNSGNDSLQFTVEFV